MTIHNSPNEPEHFSPHAQASLPPSSLRRVWRSVASRLDELIYEQFIRRAHFSVGGAAQLKQVDGDTIGPSASVLLLLFHPRSAISSQDVRAIVATFTPLTSKPLTALPATCESAELLSLPRETRDELLNERNAPERLRAKLDQLGVHHLRLAEVVELLPSVVDE